jgi:hypothetical protein
VDGAAVGGGFAEGGEGVGEGVWLELEADLDDVEGGDDESGRRAHKLLTLYRGSLKAYRETSPAIAPAEMTWSFEPCGSNNPLVWRVNGFG